MGALKLALLALSVALATPAAAEPLERWAIFIAEASHRFQLPKAWIREVMRAESGGRTMLDGRPIVSRAGAMGLMQLMPGTWRAMRAAHGLGADPHDPRDNILAGTAYLRVMYDRFGYPGLFAAYNAGPSRFSAYLRGRPLPRETVAYLAAVAGIRAGRSEVTRKSPAPRPPPVLFAFRAAALEQGISNRHPSMPSAATGLFVPLGSSTR